MSILHRVLYTWFTILVFLILLVLRVDNRTQWSWFLVFTPFWIFNIVFMMYSGIDILTVYSNRPIDSSRVVKDVYGFIAIFLIMCFEVMLCLKLDSPSVELSMVEILLPLWVVLPIVTVQVFVLLLKSTI